jgi:hypothetical protein
MVGERTSPASSLSLALVKDLLRPHEQLRRHRIILVALEDPHLLSWLISRHGWSFLES